MRIPRTWEEVCRRSPTEKERLYWAVKEARLNSRFTGPLTAREMLMWLRLDKEPIIPRPHWTYVPEEHRSDPLHMALRAKNRRAAREMLRRRPSLTHEQAARYAILTLQWAPDLLELILDRAPEGELFGSVTVSYPEKIHRARRAQSRLSPDFLMLSGSLTFLAAGLNAPASLELLLSRGFTPFFDFKALRWQLARRHLRGEPTSYFRSDLPLDSYIVMGGLRHSEGGRHPDPLTAAIFRNSPACIRILLRATGGILTPQARRFLATGHPCCGPVRTEFMHPFLHSLLGDDFEDQMDLADYNGHIESRDELYLRCLLKAPTIPLDTIRRFVLELGEYPDQNHSPEWSILCAHLLRREDFSPHLHHLLCRDSGRTARKMTGTLAPMGLTLNREWIKPEQEMTPNGIHHLLACFTHVSPPPVWHLSPLAQTILDAFLPEEHDLRQLMQDNDLLSLLREEPSAHLLNYLTGRTPPTRIQLLRVVLWPGAVPDRPEFDL